MDPRLFLGMLEHAGAQSARDHLPHVNVPSLIVAGTDDTFTPYRLSQEMHALIPNSELLTVPGGTHVSPIEQPELLTLRLEKWLSQLPPARTPRRSRAAS
jgi:pimeloyl-ACP methyl ester carboxylesterase